MDLSSQHVQHEPKWHGLRGKIAEGCGCTPSLSILTPNPPTGHKKREALLPCQQGKSIFSSGEEGACCWKDLAKTEKQRGKNRQGICRKPQGGKKWEGDRSEQMELQSRNPLVRTDGLLASLWKAAVWSLPSEEFQRDRVALGRLNELKMNDKNILELDKQMRLQKKQNELGIVGAQLELNREKEHLPGPKTCCGEEWPQTCSSDERWMANTGRTVEAREA